MLFNSYQFIFIFLPVVFFGYYFLTSLKFILASRAFLVGSSLFFYSRWNWVKRYSNIVTGIFIFSIGLFKKLSIADTFAIWANSGYGHTPNLAFFEAWATSLSYTFQLYFDFSGYSDMAVGLALLFNIKLPFNFNSPYKSK